MGVQRIIINMRNFVFAEAVERALRTDGDFNAVVADKPEDVARQCVILAANALLMEVTGQTPYTLEERLRLRDQVKKGNPSCKIVLLVDENSEKKTAEQVKQAKRDGLIDQFIYGSTSASYLVALLDTL